MSAQSDGGSAFPKQPIWENQSGLRISMRQDGMTLRDYFAAKAMVGLLASPRTPDNAGADITSGIVARLSYAVADAMLKAREVES